MTEATLELNENENEKIWVEVEVNKFESEISIYRGFLKKSVLLNWIAGTLTTTCFKLEKTHWYVEDELYILGEKRYQSEEYTGDVYLRVDTLVTIYTLKTSDIEKEQLVSHSNITHFPAKK